MASNEPQEREVAVALSTRADAELSVEGAGEFETSLKPQSSATSMTLQADRRSLATLAYRSSKAVRNAPPGFSEVQAVKSACEQLARRNVRGVLTVFDDREEFDLFEVARAGIGKARHGCSTRTSRACAFRL